MPRANRPCLGRRPDGTSCGIPTQGSYCSDHQRNRNLARDLLQTIADRDRWTCQLCDIPVTHRGHDAQAASLDHIDGDVTNDHPTNLRLAHNDCNAARQQAGWTV